MGASNSSAPAESTATEPDGCPQIPEEIGHCRHGVKLVYLALAANGESKATELCERLQMATSTIYDPLQRLQELGVAEKRPALHGNGYYWRVAGTEPETDLEISLGGAE